MELENKKNIPAVSIGILLPNGVYVPLEAIHSHTMKKKQSPVDPDQRAQFNYKLAFENFELLARQAYDTRQNSIQKIIDDMVFKRGWKDTLEELRAKHRKLGYKDIWFYPASVLRKMGLKPRLGRPKKHKFARAA